jgi:integrase
LTDKDEGKLSKNSVISILRSFRTFINYANELDWSNIYPFKKFKLDTESYGEPVFITIEERDKLYDAEIDNECLARVRDMFVFQCFIGCRVSDLVKLKKSNIIDGCIEYIAIKTEGKNAKVARIPLTEKAMKILDKYDFPNGDLLPYITDQRYNEYIKALFRKVKLKRMVTVADPNTRKSVQKPICDIATSHMARRVFIGNLHHKGAKNEIIASMSGHVENSKAFSRYYNINKEDQTEAMKLIE